MTEYAPHPGHPCPRFRSPHPHLHPAVQHGGEVETCVDEFHLVPTNQNTPGYIQSVLEKRAVADGEGRPTRGR